MEGFEVVALALAGLPPVKKVVDLLRYIFEGQVIQWREIVLVVAAWAVGFGIVVLVALSDYAESIGLAGLNIYSLILIGIVVGSSASTVHDVFGDNVAIE